MIHVRRFTDGPACARAVLPFLQRNEAANNLALRVVMRFADGTVPVPADVYLSAACDSAADGARVCGVATRTPPFGLVLSYPSKPAIAELLDAALQTGPLPGVIGEAGEASEFAARWTQATGGTHHVQMSLRTHLLERVEIVPGPGRLRAAAVADPALLAAWMRAFFAEVSPHGPPRPDPIELDGLHVWEMDGTPVAMARGLRISPTLAVINAVYTPPDQRRRGWATSLVAALSGALLAEGCPGCVLFTDLANPTSNAIYRRIGYRPMVDFQNFVFTPA